MQVYGALGDADKKLEFIDRALKYYLEFEWRWFILVRSSVSDNDMKLCFRVPRKLIYGPAPGGV